MNSTAVKFAAAFLGHAILLLVFFWWTGIGDDSRGLLMLSAGVALLWLIAFAALQWFLFRGSRWREAIQRPTLWAAIALVAGAVGVAWKLIDWTPNVTGLPWQLTSVALRFALAWCLINAAWIALARQAALPPSEDGIPAIPGE